MIKDSEQKHFVNPNTAGQCPTRCVDSTRQARELAHFESLIRKTGDVWWGNLTEAGQARMARRGTWAKQQLISIRAQRILELGCGTGQFTETYADGLTLAKIWCCDISPLAVQAAQHRCKQFPNVKFKTADILELSFPDDYFDAILGNGILHHLPVDAALDLCHRLLKPNGVLILFEPNRMNPHVFLERQFGCLRRWLWLSPDEVAFSRWTIYNYLTQHNFDSISVDPIDFLHPLTPTWMIRPVQALGHRLEQTPLVRELAGSLAIKATPKVAFNP